MLIDWFTVGAQALNFVILVWLMKHFLYKPILHAIDAREQRIAKELADADATRLDAQKRRDDFQNKNDQLDRERAALSQQATADARAERQRLFDDARQAADSWSAKRRAALTSDARALSRSIRLRTQQEVFAIARKALAELATTSLEERMVEVFTRRLATMDDDAKTRFAEALTKTAEPALVRSAFELAEEQRGKIRIALEAAFATTVSLRFETTPQLIGGLELSKSGQKIAWSIADYMTALEHELGELSQASSSAMPAPAGDAEPAPSAVGRCHGYDA